MKSRITTYVLIVAVVAVWGFVAWKIFSSKPDKPPIAVQHVPTRIMDNDAQKQLLLDYKDPFLKGTVTAKPLASIALNQPKTKPTTPKITVPPAPLPFKYTGTISTGDRRLYIFEYSGAQHMLAADEELAGYKLTEIWPDSIRFSKEGEFFTAILQN